MQEISVNGTTTKKQKAHRDYVDLMHFVVVFLLNNTLWHKIFSFCVKGVCGLNSALPIFSRVIPTFACVWIGICSNINVRID